MFRKLSLCITAFVTFLSVDAYAEVAVPAQGVSTQREVEVPEAKAEPEYRITIRAVEARIAAPDSRGQNRAMVDDRLKDIRTKLEQIERFNQFSMVSSFERVMRLKQVEQIDLIGGQILRIKPVSFNPPRVCLWLRWEDSNGEEILDSRMHFNTADSVLAGMEKESEQESLILAINAVPVASGQQ